MKKHLAKKLKGRTPKYFWDCVFLVTNMASCFENSSIKLYMVCVIFLSLHLDYKCKEKLRDVNAELCKYGVLSIVSQDFMFKLRPHGNDLKFCLVYGICSVKDSTGMLLS